MVNPSFQFIQPPFELIKNKKHMFSRFSLFLLGQHRHLTPAGSRCAASPPRESDHLVPSHRCFDAVFGLRGGGAGGICSLGQRCGSGSLQDL